MKVKTSVSLSKDLVEELDRELADARGRSEFIEAAVRVRLRQLKRARNFDHEVAMLNAIVDGASPPEMDPAADPFDLGSPASELVDPDADEPR